MRLPPLLRGDVQHCVYVGEEEGREEEGGSDEGEGWWAIFE